MEIYLVRICERLDGSEFVERKPYATTDDEYVAISHVWGTPDTVQKYTIDGITWEVSLSTEKQNILPLLRRNDVCGSGWFWMDLFCIDQTESSSISISDQLKAIPSIYKSSKCVKVLLESPVCMKWHDATMQVFERGPINIEGFQEEELAHGRSCPHLLFADPWFDRLWTRQEGLYACVLNFIALKPIACKRDRRDPTSAWISHGTLLAQRFRVESFLLDKLAYHGLQSSITTEMLFSIYFDVIYRRQLNITLAYNCKPGPDPKYNPITEAWRSQRCTTKPRDYVLAVFPDVDGYKVPAGARHMSFPELILDAIRQPAVKGQLQFAPKIPRGVVCPSARGTASAVPWFIDQPSNIGEAYDTFTTGTVATSQTWLICNEIKLEYIDVTKSGLDLLKDDWERTSDIRKHASLVSPSGPCTGTTRQHIKSTVGLLQQHFVETFMHIAVSQFLPREEMDSLELRTKGIVSLDRIQDIPDEDFAHQLKRFLVCLICGVSLFVADMTLEAADIVRVSTPHWSLLGIVHKATKLTTNQNQALLISNSLWYLQGFSIGVRIDGGVSIKGRTSIPNQSVWGSIEEQAAMLKGDVYDG